MANTLNKLKRGSIQQRAAIIWKEYEDILSKYEPSNVKIAELERCVFYDRTKNAFAVVQTGENALYENIILRKGTL